MGTVKLGERRAEEAIFLRDELGRSARLGDLAPSRKARSRDERRKSAGTDLG